MSNLLVFIQDDDVKSLQLATYFKEYGQMIPLGGRADKYLLSFLKNMLHYRIPDKFIFRYLNDYKSLLVSLVRFCIDLTIIVLCQILRIKIEWICHNVDRESTAHHPKLSSFRRKLIANSARRIYVTDPLLLPFARSYFPKQALKLEYITFGVMGSFKEINQVDTETETQIDNFLKSFNAKYSHKKKLTCWVAGRANGKTEHFFQATRLVENAQPEYEIGIVLIGDISRFMKEQCPAELERIKKCENILLLESYRSIDEASIAQKFDFYWRAYNDLSTPTSVYFAAFNRKPIITLNLGFIAALVGESNLGFVVENDFSNLRQQLDALKSWNSSKTQAFLEQRNWDIGAGKIARS